MELVSGDVDDHMQKIVGPSTSSLQHANSSLHFEKIEKVRCKQNSPAARTRNGAKTSMCHHFLTSVHKIYQMLHDHPSVSIQGLLALHEVELQLYCVQ